MNRKLLVLSMTSAAILGTAIGVTSIKETVNTQAELDNIAEKLNLTVNATNYLKKYINSIFDKLLAIKNQIALIWFFSCS